MAFQVAQTGATIISLSSDRLPMALSSVITDVEAEGINQLVTATFMTSRSVSESERLALLRTCFEYEVEGEEEVTALGKKMGAEDEEGVGIVVANPMARKGALGEITSSVIATQGKIIYVASEVDLVRGEGLFEDLAPAVERLLASGTASSPALIVIFRDSQDLEESKTKFEGEAVKMLANIVQDGTRAERIEEVFDYIEYLQDDTARAALMEIFLEGEDRLLNPSDAEISVATAVALGMVESTTTTLSSVDLAAMSKLGVASKNAFDSAVSIIQDIAGDDAKLIPKFGELCDSTVKRVIDEFNAAIGPFLLKKSSVARRKRQDLIDEIVAELGQLHQGQLEQFQLACFEEFKRKLSKLSVGPNLSQDMETALSETLKEFMDQGKELYLKLPNTWMDLNTLKVNFKKSLKEFSTDRLQAARLSGAYRPVPRKGIGLGLHWLLPKPFGNDYRQSASEIYRGNLVYSPKNKVMEVDKGDIQMGNGDWRKCIVPVPAAPDATFQSGAQ